MQCFIILEGNIRLLILQNTYFHPIRTIKFIVYLLYTINTYYIYVIDTNSKPNMNKNIQLQIIFYCGGIFGIYRYRHYLNIHENEKENEKKKIKKLT